MGRFHQGAFYLAHHLGIDVLPLVLYGTGMALPKHGRLLRRWPLHLEIGARISPEELASYGDTLRAQASFLRKSYVSRYSEIADRIERTRI